MSYAASGTLHTSLICMPAGSSLRIGLSNTLHKFLIEPVAGKRNGDTIQLKLPHGTRNQFREIPPGMTLCFYAT